MIRTKKVLIVLLLRLFTLVPRAGIEPARDHSHRILNPARLPVPPPRQSPQIITTILKIASFLFVYFGF